MSNKTAPIFASSFLRQSSLLHGSLIDDDSKLNKHEQYHWYNTNNTECVTFPASNDDILNQNDWLHLLSLISTRFIQVSWRILHDLQIAPPSNTYHLQNHDEWVMVEISYNELKSIACIQTINKTNSNNYDDNKTNSNVSSLSSISLSVLNEDSNPLIKLSPLIITDLHLSYTFNPNHLSLISLNNMNKIGFKSIDFHNFPIAKMVRFQVISCVAYDINGDYNNIVSKYMLENKVNDIELMKDDYYVHHKCIWKTQIVAIPVINSDLLIQEKQSKLSGIAALKHFYENKEKLNTNSSDYSVKYWIYVKILDIMTDNEEKKQCEDEYYRILPAVTTFVQIKQSTHSVVPRLCEYFTSVLLHAKERINGDNLFYNYKIPSFYQDILLKILFPNIYYKYNDNKHILNVNPTFLIIAQRGHNLSINLENICKVLGINYIYKNCVDLLGQNMSKTVELMKNFFNSCLEYKPLILHLDCLHLFLFEANIHSFYNNSGKIKPILPIANVLQSFINTNHNRNKIIIFAEANNISKITREVRAIFTFEHIIQSQFNDDELGNDKCKTEIIPTSLQQYINDLNLINGLNTSQLFEIINSNNNNNNYQEIVDNIRYRQSLYNISVNINVSSIPAVEWSDIGGLEHAKQEIFNIIELPLKYKHIFAHIKQSCGILLYGPPGTGKTLLAKAIATEYKMNFISIKGPELLNPYVGQSEANIRDVFSKAIQSRPCILFFDEIDALVPARGKGIDGGNVMDRIVSQLLTEIDTVSSKYNGEIFLIAATNRPDLLDASLLRPKRLDKQIYLGVPDQVKDKLKIIMALTRKFKFNEEKCKKMDILTEIAGKKEIEGFTGADLYALCCDAMMYSLKLLIAQIEGLILDKDISVDLFLELVQNKQCDVLQDKYDINMSEEEWNKIKEFDVKLDLSHFEKALINLKPSLSRQEIMRYQSIHRNQHK